MFNEILWATSLIILTFLYIDKLSIARTLNFNWIITDQVDQNLKKRCIELEYALRPKLTRFLLDRFETDCCGDFSCFHFDVEVATGNVSISRKTPWEFRRTAMRDFDLLINNSNPTRVAS